MSPIFPKDVSSTEMFFRTVNGSKLKLIDKSTKARNVMKFVLYRNIQLNVNKTLLLLFVTVVLWKAFNIFIPFLACALVLILQLICFVASVNKGLLTNYNYYNLFIFIMLISIFYLQIH